MSCDRPCGCTEQSGRFVASMASSGRTHLVSAEARARMLVDADLSARTAQRSCTA